MGRAKKRKTPTVAPLDVFEADDGAADAMTDKRRYVGTDVYEYEMPDNFDDEEIDSDEAFNDEDRRKYGSLFGGSAGAEQDDEAPVRGARTAPSTRARASRSLTLLVRVRPRSWSTCCSPTILRRALRALSLTATMMVAMATLTTTTTMASTLTRPRLVPGSCVTLSRCHPWFTGIASRVLSELSQYAGPSPGAKVRVRDEPAREGEFNLVAGVGEGEEAVSLAMLAKTLEGNRGTPIYRARIRPHSLPRSDAASH